MSNLIRRKWRKIIKFINFCVNVASAKCPNSVVDEFQHICKLVILNFDPPAPKGTETRSSSKSKRQRLKAMLRLLDISKTTLHYPSPPHACFVALGHEISSPTIVHAHISSLQRLPRSDQNVAPWSLTSNAPRPETPQKNQKNAQKSTEKNSKLKVTWSTQNAKQNSSNIVM